MLRIGNEISSGTLIGLALGNGTTIVDVLENRITVSLGNKGSKSNPNSIRPNSIVDYNTNPIPGQGLSQRSRFCSNFNFF